MGNTTAFERTRRTPASLKRLYIVVGIKGSNTNMPKERIYEIDPKDDERLFKQIRAAVRSLRPFYRHALSLKTVSRFGIYQCFPEEGYHAPVQLHPQTKQTLAVFFAAFQSGKPDEGIHEWLDWVQSEFNDPQKGYYALELIPTWSPHRFVFWGIFPVALSLAIGLWYMSRPLDEDADVVAVVQTAWTIASYIVTAAALLLGVLAAITQFGGV